MQSRSRGWWAVGLFWSLLILVGCQPGDAERWAEYLNSGVYATPLPTEPPPTPTPTPPPPPFSLRTSQNLLLLGTDQRPNEGTWRTDSIMVIGIDRPHRRAAVLSIPRDLWVEIPRYGQARINQVDFIGEQVLRVEGGGPALFSQVLSSTLGLETQHWVRVNMEGFREMVDLVGGVTVQLECPFSEPIYNLTTESWDWLTLPAGEVEMDGETAYFFVRLRYFSSDIGRAGRQRQFLWALREQALRTPLLAELPEIWRILRDYFATDLTLLDVVSLATFAVTLEAEQVRASAITHRELERYITPAGADVMRIADPARVQAVIDNIWSAPVLAQDPRTDRGDCPPLPQSLPPDLSLTLNATISPTLAGLAGVPLTIFEPGQRVAVVDSSGRGIRLHSTAGLTTPVIAVYGAGSQLILLEPDGEVESYPVPLDGYQWYRVQGPDDRDGWIAGRFLVPVRGEGP